MDEMPTLASMPALDQMPSLAPALVPTPTPELTSPLVERVRAADAYVFDDGTGRMLIDPTVSAALGIKDADLAGVPEQRTLATIRQEQQRAFDDLTAEAAQRPLAFAVTGAKPWPRDLPPPLLGRLDRWSRDEGFQHDLFLKVELAVQEAHAAHRRTTPEWQPSAPAASRRLRQPIPDGFGGMRDTPAPVHQPGGAAVRVAPFEAGTLAATPSLLLLLRHAGQHPRTIEVARDGRITSLPGVPAMIVPLVDMWRHDDRVHALVAETVTASRAAGEPRWPERYAAMIRASTAGPDLGPKPPLPHDRGLSR